MKTCTFPISIILPSNGNVIGWHFVIIHLIKIRMLFCDLVEWTLRNDTLVSLSFFISLSGSSSTSVTIYTRSEDINECWETLWTNWKISVIFNYFFSFFVSVPIANDLLNLRLLLLSFSCTGFHFSFYCIQVTFDDEVASNMWIAYRCRIRIQFSIALTFHWNHSTQREFTKSEKNDISFNDCSLDGWCEFFYCSRLTSVAQTYLSGKNTCQ